MASKTILVAQREYLENVRTKTFWLGILAFPAIFALSIGVAWIMQKTKSTQKYTVLDFTERKLGREVEQAARARDFQQLIGSLEDDANPEHDGKPKDGGGPDGDGPQPPQKQQPAKPITPEEVAAKLDAAEHKLAADDPLRGLFEAMRPQVAAIAQALNDFRAGKTQPSPALQAVWLQWFGSLTPEQLDRIKSLGSVHKYRSVTPAELGVAGLPREQQVQQLNDKVRDGSLFAYFVLDQDPVKRTDKGTEGLEYVSNNLTDDDLSSWYSDAVTQVVRRARIAEASISPAVAEGIQEHIRFKARQVSATGKTEDVQGKDQANKWAPVAFVYLLWIAVFTAAQMLLTNTVEEKSNRIIEVLLSSVSPGELMTGKIWGIGVTGLTIITSWAVCGLIGAKIAAKLVPKLAELNLGAIIGSPLYLASFIGYFLTGYLLFAAILVAIGSVCNSLKEAQNLVQPVFLLLMLPLFAMIPIVQEPNGLMARVFTYIPIYTPFAMMNRASGPPAPIEYAITTVEIVVSLFLAFKAAGKVFRIGVLMTGNPPRLKDILGWLRTG